MIGEMGATAEHGQKQASAFQQGQQLQQQREGQGALHQSPDERRGGCAAFVITLLAKQHRQQQQEKQVRPPDSVMFVAMYAAGAKCWPGCSAAAVLLLLLF
jgi:integral membrane sensor domain MASE1